MSFTENPSQRHITDINTVGSSEDIPTYESGWSQHASTAGIQGKLTAGNLPYSYDEPKLPEFEFQTQDIATSGRIFPVNVQERVETMRAPVKKRTKQPRMKTPTEENFGERKLGFVGSELFPGEKTVGYIDIEKFSEDTDGWIVFIVVIVIIGCAAAVGYFVYKSSASKKIVSQGGYDDYW